MLMWARLFLGVKVEIQGVENMVKSSGCVILMNHQSLLDMYALGKMAQTFDKCMVIGKIQIRQMIDFFGYNAWLWGAVYLDRDQRNKAKYELDKVEVMIKEQNVRFCL